VKLSVVLEAIDKVTKPVREIAAKVRALNSQLGLDRLAGSVGKVGKAFGGVASAARDMAARVTAAVGIVGGGLFALVKSTADAGDNAHDLAQKIGLSAVALQELGYAAEMAGSNQDDLTNGLRVLNRQVVEAATGNKTMAENFNRLGISVKDAHGKLKPTDQIFAEIADKFEKMPDGAKKSALAMAILGDAGANLIQLMNGGSKGLAAASAEAHKFGRVLSEDAVNGAGDFNDNLARLASSLVGLRNAIATKLIPILTPLIGRFADWIVANRELISTRIGAFIEALPDKIAAVTDMAASLYARMSPLIDVFRAVANWIGPVNSALLLMGGIIAGKLLIGLAQLTLAFGGLGKALALVTIRLAKFALAPLIEMVVSFTTALRYGVGIVEAFNIALAANPIGLVIAAVAALAAGVYLLYKNWDTIGPWFTKLWQGVKDTFGNFLGWIKETFVNSIMDSFEAIWSFIGPIINKIRSGFDFANSIGQKVSGIGQQFGSMLGLGGGGTSAGGGTAIGAAAGAALGAAAVPVAQGVNVRTGGYMRVVIDDNRTRVTRLQPANPSEVWEADTGRVMPQYGR